MSASHLDIDIYIPDSAAHSSTVEYIKSSSNATGLVYSYPKISGTIEFSSYSENIEPFIETSAIGSSHAAFSLFHDMTGENLFLAYSEGKRVEAKKKAFLNKIYKLYAANDEKQNDGRSTELGKFHEMLIGNWIFSDCSARISWEFKTSTFNATMEGIKGGPWHGKYTIGDTLEKMFDPEAEEEEDAYLKCVPFCLMIDWENSDSSDFSNKPEKIFSSLLFKKKGQKLFLPFVDINGMSDFNDDFGLSFDKSLVAYDIDECLLRKI